MRVTADSVADIAERSRAIRQAVQAIRKSFQLNVHFMKFKRRGDRDDDGRDVLLLPGAQSLAVGFGLQPYFEVTSNDLAGGHREYETLCTLKDEEGRHVAHGVGMCTSLEDKYRYDKVWKNGRIVEKNEKPNPPDAFNTVKKMSKKRAFVDAVINATACSDLFTQDLEEEEEQPPAPARSDADDARKQRARERTQQANQQKQDGPELDTSNAQESPEPETDAPATYHIKLVDEVKSGRSSRGPWTLYVIATIEGDEFTTFDTAVHDQAAKCCEQKIPARIEWKMDRGKKTATKVSPRPSEGDRRPVWERGAITAVNAQSGMREGSEVRWWEVVTSQGDGYFTRHAGVAQRLSELVGTGQEIGYLVTGIEKDGNVRAEITRIKEDE